MKVVFKKKEEMSYATWDDYYYTAEGELVFEIVDTGDTVRNRIILIHALVEQLLTDAKGVRWEDITKFDLEHLDSLEPGEELDAPYRDAHLMAKGVEMILLSYLNLPLSKHEEDV